MQENMLHGWRIADKKNMRMTGYPAKSRSLDWSHDGAWLATSGADGCIVWPFSGKDGPMGQPPRECGVRPNVLVTRVAFHPKALIAAMGYDDGWILLVRLGDGAEIFGPPDRRRDARRYFRAGVRRHGRQARIRDSGGAGRRGEFSGLINQGTRSGPKHGLFPASEMDRRRGFDDDDGLWPVDGAACSA